MKWRKLNNVLHRDLGYICVGLTIIYAASGVAVNHADEWDPSYSINVVEKEYRSLEPEETESTESVINILNELDVTEAYMSHYMQSQENLKIFLDGGSVTIQVETGDVLYESVEKRPLLWAANYLHLNDPKGLWTFIADLYAAALFLLAVTGMLVLKGKNGLKGRGKWFILAGVLIPIIYLLGIKPNPG